MTSFLLKIIDLFQGVYKAFGIDYQQLRAIVKLKLTMDNRRQVMSYRKKEGQEPTNSFFWTLFFYTLFGGFIALALYSLESLSLSMAIFFSYMMVMVSMTLITDFSSILLDTSDNTIILPRPVSSRTLFVARITHICLYLGQLTACLSVVPAIVVFFKYGGVMTVIFIVLILAAVVTAILLTNLLYLLILQFSSEEKLKNIINYFQIAMAVLIMGGYQLLPRVASRLDLEQFEFTFNWWHTLVPPMWMAAGMEMFFVGSFDALHLTLTAMSFTMPLAGFYFINTYLTPLFARKLGVMNTETRQSANASQTFTITERLSTMFASGRVERGAFSLIFRVIARDRKIKLKVYPSFGYIIILAFIFLFRDKHDFSYTWSNLSNTQYHLFLIYLTFLVVQVAIHEIPYSDDFKASWIFFSSPLERPGEILSGTLKAVFVRLFLPAYTIIAVFILFAWGIGSIDDIVFGFLNNYLMLLIVVSVGQRYLPLSLSPSARNQSGNFVRSLLMFMLIGFLGLIHFLLSSRDLLVWAAIPLQLVAIYFFQRAYSRTSWERISL